MPASLDTTHVAIAPVPDETLADLLTRRAAEDPDGVYCYFKDEVLTLGALNARANQLANLLWQEGLRPGDRVGLMLPSHPDHIVAIYALAKLGLVRVPINVHLKGASLQHLFDHLAPRGLIADAEHADALAPELSKVEYVLWRGGRDAARAFERHAGQSAAEPPVRPAPDDILALTPSSGTTGAPKGVLKSDRTLRGGPQAILRLTGAQPGDTFLLWESLHHGAGVAVIISALIGGTRLAMVERFSASRFWDDARRYNVTHIHYLGTVVPMLLKQPPREGDRGHGVRIAWGGGCPPDLWKAFSERFGVQMREGYGLSELITFVTVNLDGPPGAIGKPLDYYDVLVADDEGKPVPVGTAGEITVRARVPKLGFLGYFRNPEAEASSRRGEWFLTGDLARQDAEGFLYYAGRKKEMLRRRGINISTWEVERVIAEHPEIEEVALVGVPSDLGEDELKLFVRVREKAGKPAALDPLALIKWSESRLPYYQIPRYVAFIDEFPKTPTQRIQKKELPRTVTDAWDLDSSGYRIGK
ncbi:AMP-dependent synthetase [Bordetella genomosp. 10]|uniref:AMP-dependent synthetase n=1 Tax=Bordetella genomosp. 10 TaxID=1416804 RepID=A0A261S4M4_9BORD|nr:AMP-binding protein [Bordetella genomosp. 10]OZI32105.1 AMP-dependent synthetase [Bordetella genomosp. 10]